MGFLAWAVVAGLGTLLMVGCAPLAGCIAPLLGFGVLGPVAGTIAASAQAFVGSVAAGSAFAFLQAAAMASPTP